VFLLTPVALLADPDGWIPARWTGGPLEVARGGSGAMAGWYDAATLDLLEGSPINCLLVTWSAGAADAIEAQQRRLVQAYVAAARRRGIVVLGLVYPGADPAKFVRDAATSGLNGLVLEGEFASGFEGAVRRAMAAVDRRRWRLRLRSIRDRWARARRR